MRQTFAIEPPILAAEDGTLRDYAGGLVEAMSAQFTPDLGDERLLPPQAAGTPAGVHFLVEIKLRHGGGDAVATVTLLDAASHDQLLVRTLTEPARPDLDPDRAALLGLVNDLKWAAIQREQVASEAIPPARRDARDLIILARFLQATEANELKLIADVEAARQLAPDDMHVLATVAFVLSWRVTDGLSKDPDTDLEQAQAAADRVLSHNPRQISALRAMDNVAMAQGRWEDEIVATDRVLEVAHNESTTMSHRCDAELRLGRIAAAAATLDRLLPFQTPGNAWFVGMLAARIRLGQGQYAESAEWSRKTAQLMPHDGSFAPELSILALYRASADGFLGNREDASRALADFAVLAPEIHGIAEIVKTETLPFPKAGLDRLLDGLRKAGMPE